jgi:hypothetical protein
MATENAKAKDTVEESGEMTMAVTAVAAASAAVEITAAYAAETTDATPNETAATVDDDATTKTDDAFVPAETSDAAIPIEIAAATNAEITAAIAAEVTSTAAAAKETVDVTTIETELVKDRSISTIDNISLREKDVDPRANAAAATAETTPTKKPSSAPTSNTTTLPRVALFNRLRSTWQHQQQQLFPLSSPQQQQQQLYVVDHAVLSPASQDSNDLSFESSGSDDSSGDYPTTSLPNAFYKLQTRVATLADAVVRNPQAMNTTNMHRSSSGAAGGMAATALFRGRYAGSGAVDAETTQPYATTATTTTTPNTTNNNHTNCDYYTMTLGHGMLGVNLKQGYLADTGVYVDYLVQQGAADGIVGVGHVLAHIGSDNVQQGGTIFSVPQQLARAQRPVPLQWYTNAPSTTNGNKSSNSVDMLLVKLRQETTTLTDKEESPIASVHDDLESDETSRLPDVDRTTVDAPEHAVTRITPPSSTPTNLQHEMMSTVKTTLEQYSLDAICNPNLVSIDSSNNKTAIATHALLLCVTDGRRRTFLTRYLNHYHHGSAGTASTTHALLSLFHKCLQWTDLYDVMPRSRRGELARAMVQAYARQMVTDNHDRTTTTTTTREEQLEQQEELHKNKSTNYLQQPEQEQDELDTLLACLRRVETTIGLDTNSSLPPRDLFVSVIVQAACLLLPSFTQFVTSSDCARMRAYLRETAKFYNVSLTNNTPANYNAYIVLYLLCKTDKEGFGEHDAKLAPGQGVRVENAASGYCAALFLRDKVLPALASENAKQIVSAVETLWESFVDPNVGALELSPQSNPVSDLLKQLRTMLLSIKNEESDPKQIASRLQSIVELAGDLADELMYDYAANVHPRFREHKFHEWLCAEFDTTASTTTSTTTDTAVVKLPRGCIKRLLRKAEFPAGVAPHKPTNMVVEATPIEHARIVGAQCAIVFGTTLGNTSSESGMPDSIRYRSEALEESSSLDPELIPPTLESYASCPPPMQKTFSGYGDNLCKSSDGWECSLQSFVVPRAGRTDTSGDDAPLYGASLVFHRASLSETLENGLQYDAKERSLEALGRIGLGDLTIFKEKLADSQWTDLVASDPAIQAGTEMIGLALVSEENVILSMREALSKLLEHIASSSDAIMRFRPVVNLLGNFLHSDVESDALKRLLAPFLLAAAAPWLERPVVTQRNEFEQQSARHLVQSLPPIPMALMLVTALLEQKMVFSSCRRSLLLSASTTLSKMLRPLKWWHLHVPCAPPNLAADLIEYPGPFILGLCSADPGVMDLVRELPSDVTLVDLDVGRVILAPNFAHRAELGRGTENDMNTAKMLRSQVLYLSQALGRMFGESLDPQTWMCDCPSPTMPSQTPLDAICSVAQDLIDELLAGTASCCYWIEEVVEGAHIEPTVLFDEDRFFHVKNLRESEGFESLFGQLKKSTRLALSLDDFDLVLEVFLRCQAMNVFIGSQSPNVMAFSG